MDNESILDTSEQIRKFEEFFNDNYKSEILDASRKGQDFLKIDFKKLVKFDPELADLLLEEPEEVIAASELAMKQFDIHKKFKPRFKNLPETQKIMIRNIRSKDINKFHMIDGIVRQKSDVRPQVTAAKFECPSCGNLINVLQLEQKFKEPSRCGCGRKGKFRMLSKELIDAQGITLEEAPEDLEGGEQPKRIKVFLKDDLVSPITDKHTNPGSKILINGIIKETPLTGRDGTKLTRFDLLIEANYVEPVQEDYLDLTITKEEEKQIKKLASDPKVYEKITESIAPSIFGHDRIKEALVLQLVGGVKKTRKDGMVTRGDMHILLIGDPGAGKSQILKRISNVAPKSRYVSGKGVSGAGLTASVVKDEFLGGWALEAGALPLCNRGFCCIDEMDKMSQEDTAAMHEALEGQSYHPDFEIMLANGSTVKIGDYVNKLMFKYKNKSIKGVNTKFLLHQKIPILTTDFKKIKKAKASRISYHNAPSFFIEIEFSNGRKITVTPEHPVFIWKGNKIVEWPALLVEKGMLVPAVEKYDCLSEEPRLKTAKKQHHNNKKIVLPAKLSAKLAALLGYIITEGHSYSNKKHRYAEIGISNTNLNIIKECDKLFKDIFKTTTNINLQNKEQRKKAKKDLYTVRCCSKQLYNYFQINFSEMIAKAPLKRVPNPIKVSGRSIQIPFLKSAFRGDGYINKDGFGYTTSSYRLATDYQDILLQLKIFSIIQTEKRKDKKYYKIIISGIESKEKFNKLMIDKCDSRKKKAGILCSKSKNKQNQRNPVPVELLRELRDVLNKIHINDGYFTTLIKRNQNSKKGVVKKHILKAETKLNSLKLNKETKKELNKKIKNIKNFVDSEIRLIKIKNKKLTKNKGVNYVYDITVEPTQNFISNGLVLHNTITISKANIQATLRAETTVLAAANPKFGRFDPYDILAKQINMPPTLINRFDLIFPVKDLPDEKGDERLAKHILALHKDPDFIKSEIDSVLIRKYIAYARQTCRPILTDSALDEIRKYYVEMRNKSSTEETGMRAIPISPRQLEALVRLSEASAKLRLDTKVTKKDARNSIKLVHHCLREVGLDPETGKIDIDRISTGITTSQRSKIFGVRDVIVELENRIGKTIPIEDIIKDCGAKGIDESDVEESLEKLKRSGDVFEPKHGFISRI